MFFHLPDQFLAYRESAIMADSLSFEGMLHLLATIVFLLDSTSERGNLV